MNPLKLFSRKPPVAPAKEPPKPLLTDIIERHARKMPAATIEYLKAEHEMLQGKRAAVFQSYQKAMGELLGTEFAGKRDLERQLDEALQPIDTQIAEVQARLAHHDLDTGYRRIRMDFLKLRKDQDGRQVPAVAIFSTDWPVCMFEVLMGVGELALREKAARADARVIPHEFGPEFKDVLDGLEMRWRLCSCGKNSHTSECLNIGFGGLIPPAARAAIGKAKSEFDGLYFVAEAPAWSLKPLDNGLSSASAGRDALLIGRKDGKHWLVTSFQTVTAQEYINGAPNGAREEIP
jgi:hypothetical protein